MAVSLPNGIVFALATAYAASLTVTAASNANEAVLTVTNTLAAGDFFEFTSGWSKANNRVYRAKSPTGTTIVAEGLDTTLTALYPAGTGAGSIRKINSWTQITQMMGCTSSGGEPQYQTYSFMEQDFDSQIPTTTSAQSLALEIADDPALAGYQALRTIAQTRSTTAMRGTLPSGSLILYNGIFAFDETPSMTKGNLMSVKAGVALQGRPVRYAS
ncbi:phage tail protein [Massilia sp. CCM 8733]|uniref:Phage tail protein n=1 Tax=Massilia mucilaginosa TaxID=2609282 RepID=A0ABX0P2L7_9BURK|nr:phage tail protein [Massilia mucilaginosa]NHZ93546.1 phage tail protein [Massilia mucilaginosa]